MTNRRTAAAIATALLAVAASVAIPTAASANGAGCKTRVVSAPGNVVDGWYDQVEITQTTRWTNCTTHTHPEEVSIRFNFRSDGAARDWKNDDDDYIRYSCRVISDERTVDSWSGRLNYEDRADGWNLAPALMYYSNHPRTVCTGEVVEDWHKNWTFRSSAGAN